MRLHPQQQQQQQEGKHGWDGADAPPVGSRLDCLDVFRNLQTAQAGSAWRPAVVVGVRDKDDGERDIKVHFEEFSSGYDKWISWPRERNRFASRGTGGSLGTPPGLADRPGGGRPAARSGHAESDAHADTGSGVSESRSNSSVWEADGRSSSVASTGARRMKPALRKKGFSRLKVFSAVKSILRAQVDVYGVYDTNVGNSSCSERATPTPPFTVSPGTSMSPGSPTPSGTAGRRDEGVGGRKTRDEPAAPPFEKIPFEGEEEEVKREETETEEQEEEEEKEGGFEQEEKFEAETKDEEREATEMGEAEEEEEKRESGAERKNGPGEGAGESSPTVCFSSLVPLPPCAAEGDRHSHPAAPVAVADASEGEGGIALPPRPAADGSISVDPCATAGAAAPGAAAAAPTGAAAASAAAGKAPAKQRMGGWRTKIKSRNRNRQRPPAPLRDADEAEACVTVSGGAGSNHVVESEGGARKEDGRAAAAAAKEVGGGGGKSSKGGGGQEAEAEAVAVAVSRRPALKQPTRELTPHLVEEEGGFFTLTVFRNNKQDQVPVPVVCGRYVSAYEAERAAEAFSSPVWHEPSPDSRCSECNSNFRAVLARRRHHCRNCGRLVCSSCAMRFWPKSMLPYSYKTDSTEIRVRVCRTCYSSGNDFRRALLLGSFPDAMEAYNRGCVNLRAPCSQSDMELPVHCAAAGGNVSLLAWLIEDRCCPIFRNEDKTYPLLDAKGRSVMAAAAHSGQVKIMRYLTFTQPSTVMDVGWVALWRGLHLCLSQGEAGGKGGSSGGGSSGRNSGSGDNNISDVCGWAPYSGVSAAKSSCGGGVQQSCYPLGGGIEGAAWRNDGRGGGGGGYHDDEWAISAGAGGDEGNPLAQAVLGAADDGGYAVYDMPGTRSHNDDIGRGGGGGKGKNVCIVCFARKVNCTFVPCGHHCCCMPCTAKFELCPVCNVRITQKVKAIDA